MEFEKARGPIGILVKTGARYADLERGISM